jgi:hypothetical protein
MLYNTQTFRYNHKNTNQNPAGKKKIHSKRPKLSASRLTTPNSNKFKNSNTKRTSSISRAAEVSRRNAVSKHFWFPKYVYNSVDRFGFLYATSGRVDFVCHVIIIIIIIIIIYIFFFFRSGKSNSRSWCLGCERKARITDGNLSPIVRPSTGNYTHSCLQSERLVVTPKKFVEPLVDFRFITVLCSVWISVGLGWGFSFSSSNFRRKHTRLCYRFISASLDWKTLLSRIRTSVRGMRLLISEQLWAFTFLLSFQQYL